LRGYNSRHPKTWDEQIVYILTIEHFILPPISLLSRLALVIYLLHYLILFMDNRRKKHDYKGKNKKKHIHGQDQAYTSKGSGTTQEEPTIVQIQA
jgi:hypothetical protein